MNTIIGIFSDIPAGTVILLVILAGLSIKFSAANLFKDSGGGDKSQRSGGSSNSNSNNTGPIT